jgi:hypothetical protein
LTKLESSIHFQTCFRGHTCQNLASLERWTIETAIAVPLFLVLVPVLVPVPVLTAALLLALLHFQLAELCFFLRL